MSARTMITATAVAACVALGLPTIGGAARRVPGGVAQAASGRRSVWDGVYTDAQAKRGRDAYEYSCSTCHLPELEGDSARDVPPLSGEEFVDGWSKQTVKDLFDLISKAMPKDSPGSLRAETCVDIVTYLLQANEFPSGGQELAADVTVLDRIGIDKTPPAGK